MRLLTLPILLAALTPSLLQGQEFFYPDFNGGHDQALNLAEDAAFPDGYWAAWTDAGICYSGGSWGLVIVGRRMNLDGTFPDRGFIVGEGGCQSLGGRAPDVAVRPDGSVMFFFRSVDADGNGIIGRLFDVAGTPLTPSFVVNENERGTQTGVRGAALPDGGFVATWHDQDTPYGGSTGVPTLRILNPDASFRTGDIAVDAEPLPAGGGIWSKVAVWPSGRILATWIDRHGSIMTTYIAGQLFAPDGTALSGQFEISKHAVGSTRWDTDMAIGTDRAIIAWADVPGPQYGNQYRVTIFARILKEDGTFVGERFLVPADMGDWAFWPSCGMDAANRSVIAWGTMTPSEVHARRFDENGIPAGKVFKVAGIGDVPHIAMQPSGDFLVTYQSIYRFKGRRYAFPVSLAVAPGPAATNPPLLQALRPDGTPGFVAFPAFGSTGYGADIASGDIDGGTDEMVAGPGPSPVYGPQVRGYRAAGKSIDRVNFYAYGTLRYGVHPAAVDIDDDGFSEILTGPGPGDVFGPHVRGFDFDGGKLRPAPGVSFFAYQTLRYGANVSGGVVNPQSTGSYLLTTPGPGPSFGAQVRSFAYNGSSIAPLARGNFVAFSSATYGATIASTDYESDSHGVYGDGFDEFVVGKGPGPANAAVFALFDLSSAPNVIRIADVTVDTSMYGLNVAGGDVDAGDTGEVVAGAGPDPTSPGRVTCWEWDNKNPDPDTPQFVNIGPDDFISFQGLNSGVHVSVGRFP